MLCEGVGIRAIGRLTVSHFSHNSIACAAITPKLFESNWRPYASFAASFAICEVGGIRAAASLRNDSSSSALASGSNRFATTFGFLDLTTKVLMLKEKGQNHEKSIQQQSTPPLPKRVPGKSH